MLKKFLKIAVLVVVVAFVIGQFVRPDFTNPQVVEAETLRASMQVPANVQQVLERSCNDCHSNETKYPWYAKITPSNWYLKNHIDEGRRELNLSVWNTYSPKKKAKKLEEVCEQVEQGEMPLPSYLWIHRDAALASGDAELLCNWAKAEETRIKTENGLQ